MVRLAFAVRPPVEVREVLARLPRPTVARVTWSEPEQWIVKVRPLGHVPDHLREPLLDAVEGELAGAPPTPVRMGPSTSRLAGQWLGVPVSGLADLAAGVFAATAPIVPVTHPQPFRADLVLARGRVPRDLAGAAVHAEWTVSRIVLVADRSSPDAPRLEDVGAIDLTG